MLNISDNRIIANHNFEQYGSYEITESARSRHVPLKLMAIFSVLGIILLFMPWSQNIQSKGKVTALNPWQRPQTIHSVIGGQIVDWKVKEGDFVSKGDTIAQISETKDDYFDPNLLGRTSEQIKAKELSVGSYMNKVQALDNQIDALLKTQTLKQQEATNKLKQAKLKYSSDSIDLLAEITNIKIAARQLEGEEEMYKEGIVSLTDVEAKRQKYQAAVAKKISQENKLLSAENDVINAQVSLINIKNEFADKIAKSESEKFASMSNMYDSEAAVTKLQNQYVNYSVRTGLYYITAPQDGYIAKALITGIGETIKAGSPLVSIMPADVDLAVEMYVRPIDLPLLKTGQEVRLQFDGWPALVFSGWPGMSFGTFGGKVVAIDRFANNSGNYRVLVSPDAEEYTWPDAIRVGAGVFAMSILKDVPIWYELWRQINGFPPDYYVYEGESEFTKNK